MNTERALDKMSKTPFKVAGEIGLMTVIFVGCVGALTSMILLPTLYVGGGFKPVSPLGAAGSRERERTSSAFLTYVRLSFETMS